MEKTVNIWMNRTQCRLCNSSNITCIFNLEPTPLANHFVSEKKTQCIIPLDLYLCETCNHIQLLQIVNPEIQYIEYPYVSSTSKTMTLHLQNSMNEFIDILNLKKNDTILEIGANNGVCIKYLIDYGFSNVVGIDPAQNIYKTHSLPIIPDFFGSKIIDTLYNKYGLFKLIFAFHCCAHIETIQDVFTSVYKLLDDDGSFIVEVGYFYEVFKNMSFDVIYHEHIDYHTCTAMNFFSKKQHLKLYKVRENNIQGGSIQFFFCKETAQKEIDSSVQYFIDKESSINLFNKNNLLTWSDSIISKKKYILDTLQQLVLDQKIIVGYGAPAKLTTFMYLYQLNNDLIKYIIDDNSYKQGLFTPGTHIPIKNCDILNTYKVDYIFLFCWNFADEIIPKLQKYRDNGIKIIIPFPDLKIM